MDDLPQSNFWDRWLWLCPAVSIALAALLLMWFGLTWWTALLVALLLVCPATLLWGAFMLALDAWRAKHRPHDADNA
jgi:hypothetical protein